MALTINQAKANVLKEFIAKWADETIVFGLDNEEFDEPEGVPWVRVVVRNAATRQTTLGRTGVRKFLRKGIVMALIFVPEGSGTDEADRLADKMRTIFEGIRLGEIWFEESDVREIGSDGKFYQVNVNTIFNYEETK